MPLDVVDRYFVVDLTSATKVLTDEEFETMQGLIKKVDMLIVSEEKYIVIPRNQCPTLFASLLELINNIGGKE